MSFFLLLVSLVLVIKGVMLILAPKKVLKFATSLLSQRDPKTLAIVPLATGVLLLLARSASALGWLIVLLGLAEIVKAVYLFSNSAAKIQSHRWFSLSDNGHRALGILVLVLGVIVFASRV